MIYTAFMAFASIYGFVFQKQIRDDKRSRIAYCSVMGLLLFLIAGLRGFTVGSDSSSYAHIFHTIASMDWADVPVKYDKEPLFYLFIKLLSCISTSYTFLFCVIGAIFATAVSVFIYKTSEAPFLSYVMLIPMQFYPFTLSGCRQAVALSLVLFAFFMVLKRSYLKFIIVLFAAYFVHNSIVFAIPFLLMPLLKKKAVARVLLLVSMIICYIFSRPILNFITSYVYTDYDIFEDSQGSVTTLIMYLAILVLCAVFVNNDNNFRPSQSKMITNYIDKNLPGRDLAEKEASYYQVLEAMLGFGILIQVFVPLQPSIFRAAMYYQIVSILIVPKVIYSIQNKIIRGAALLGFYGVMIILYFRFTFYAVGANPYKFFWQYQFVPHFIS